MAKIPIYKYMYTYNILEGVNKKTSNTSGQLACPVSTKFEPPPVTEKLFLVDIKRYYSTYFRMLIRMV